LHPLYLSYMLRQTSYGIVPLKRKKTEWYVLIVKRKEGFWEFPKGHAEEGESHLEAAARELTEESGLEIKTLIFDDPIKIQYYFTFEHQLISKEVLYYIAEVMGKIELQPKETIDSVWVPLAEAANHVTHQNSKDLCKEVIERIRKID
jgi:8-oxo-dGTP pyrophosphatase MutT (NUDIX family)